MIENDVVVTAEGTSEKTVDATVKSTVTISATLRTSKDGAEGGRVTKRSGVNKLCKDCPFFKIIIEPVRVDGELFELGQARCEKYDMLVDFADHRKLNKLECVKRCQICHNFGAREDGGQDG